MYKNLEHLSNEEVNTLIDKYYNGDITVNNLLKEYDLAIPSSKLYSLFPPQEYGNYTCEYCNVNLVVDRKSKSNNTYYEKELYCPVCSHKPYITNCDCVNCYEKNQQILSIKKLQINSMYSKSNGLVEFESLSFEEKVFLGTLVDYAMKENLYEFESYNKICKNYDLATNDKMKSELYKTLTHANVIKVSPLSEISAFDVDDFPATYFIYKVMYDMNLKMPSNKQDLFNQILNPKYYDDKYKSNALIMWKKIAVAECIEYLINQLNKVGFDFEAGEKTYSTFEILLEDYSASQIYGAIWRSVAEASKLYLEKKMSKKHAANTTIGSCRRYIERAKINEWKLSEYSRPKDLPQSELSRFFFNRVIKIGELGFTMQPNVL